MCVSLSHRRLVNDPNIQLYSYHEGLGQPQLVLSNLYEVYDREDSMHDYLDPYLGFPIHMGKGKGLMIPLIAVENLFSSGSQAC